MANRKAMNKLQHNFPLREVMTGDDMIEKNSIPYAPWKFIFLRTLVMENNLFFLLRLHRLKSGEYKENTFVRWAK